MSDSTVNLHRWGVTPSEDAGTILKRDLEARINSGDWPPGFKLPGERALAAQFNVSRAAVREVLQTLAVQGYLQISPARGAFVRRPDGRVLSGALSQLLRNHGATVRDVVEARDLLETEITGRAAGNCGGDVIEHLADLAELVDSGSDRLEQAITDLKFHSLLCVGVGNPVLTAMHRSIAPYVLFMTLRRDRTHEPTGAMHSQIVEAIRAGNAEKSRTLSRAHLDATKLYFGDDFDRPVEEVAAENLRRISGGFWTLEDVVQQAFTELDAVLPTTDKDV